VERRLGAYGVSLGLTYLCPESACLPLMGSGNAAPCRLLQYLQMPTRC